MSERHKDQDEQLVRLLADSIMGLSCELQKIREQAHEEHQRNAILYRVERKIDQIMATQAELAADLRAVRAKQEKTAAEIADVQAGVDTLKAKVVELEAIIAAGVAPSQELVDAVAAVKAQAQVVDDLIPDLPTPEPA